MLTEIGISNFKAWRHLPSMRMAPLTALFGINSAGKSSLLQMLLLQKQTVESADRTQVLNLGDKRSFLELGAFSDIAYRHNPDASIGWQLEWTLPKELQIRDEETGAIRLKAQRLRFEASVITNGNGRPLLDNFHYTFANHKFGMRKNPGQSNGYDLQVDPDDFFKRTRGRPWDLPAPVRCYGFPDRVKASYQNSGFLSDFALAYEDLFSRLYYLGPLRDYPQREYTWGGSEPSDMGTRGERVIDALLSARQKGKTISPGRHRPKRSLEEHVAKWLMQLGLIHSFRIEELAPSSNLYRVLVRRNPDAPEVLLTDVGFGVSQVLPVLALCFYVPEGSIILLEHPEIHLHPSVQAGLADVLIDAITNRNVQILLESHSEHLLQRLQRRIAEETLPLDKVALYFCGISNQGATLTDLKMNLYGEIENWPENFFGDEFGEITATQLAALKRKSQAAPK